MRDPQCETHSWYPSSDLRARSVCRASSGAVLGHVLCSGGDDLDRCQPNGVCHGIMIWPGGRLFIGAFESGTVSPGSIHPKSATRCTRVFRMHPRELGEVSFVFQPFLEDA